MTRMTVYTTDPCSFCTRVKRLLDSRGVEFTEINLSRDAEGRSELVQRTGMMSFPQVILDGTLIGGGEIPDHALRPVDRHASTGG